MKESMMERRLFLGTVAGAVAASNARGAEVPRRSSEFVIKTVPPGEILLSKYKGKPIILTLISTTCPHCQKLTGILNQLHREFQPKGVQILGAAFNPMANMYLPDFVKQYRPEYPMGWSSREPVLQYLEHSPMIELYVPIVVGIDRGFTIREQSTGDANFFQNEEANLRKLIATLTGPAKPAATRKKSAS
jgi:thiol-disulfide isomerase/thioredoxin